MEIKVLKEYENPFFKRKDMMLEISHAGGPTPKTDDVRKELAAKCNVDASQVVVEYIMTKGGLNISTARVKILNEKPAIVEEKPIEEKPGADAPQEAA